ncbi:MAG: hypothetical protein AAF235_02630 [Planctomycetota bacterium]
MSADLPPDDASREPTRDAGMMSHLCISCGYDITGLDAENVCPECGTPVRDSLRGPYMWQRDIGWMRRLRRGAVLASVSLLFFIVATVIEIASGIVIGSFAVGGLGQAIITAVATAMALAAALLSALGWWYLTERDPGSRPGQRGDTTRRTARIATIVNGVLSTLSALGTPLFGGIMFAAGGATPLPTAGGAGLQQALTLLGFALAILSFAAWLTKFFAGMLLIQHFARRMASPKLMSMTRFRIWFCPVIGVVGVVACYAGPIVAIVLYYNLLVKLRDMLGRAIKAAGDTHGFRGNAITASIDPTGPR